MAIMTFFKKLFSGEMDDVAGNSVKAEETAGNSSGSGRAVALKDLEGFVNYVVTPKRKTLRKRRRLRLEPVR